MHMDDRDRRSNSPGHGAAGSAEFDKVNPPRLNYRDSEREREKMHVRERYMYRIPDPIVPLELVLAGIRVNFELCGGDNTCTSSLFFSSPLRIVSENRPKVRHTGSLYPF